MFSLTNQMRVFKPKDPSKAVWHSNLRGPSFTFALAVIGTMNHENQGWCATEGHEKDRALYCIPKDSNGNSILTGDNGQDPFGETGRFTCVELEVFLIE